MSTPDFAPTTPVPYVPRPDSEGAPSGDRPAPPARPPGKPASVALVQAGAGLLLLMVLRFGPGGQLRAAVRELGFGSNGVAWWALMAAVVSTGVFATIGVQRRWLGSRVCGLVVIALLFALVGWISFMGLVWAMVGGLVVPALIYCAIVVALFVAWMIAFTLSPGARRWFAHRALR